MKKLLLGTVALSVMAGAALAADLPYRRAAPAPAPAYVAVPVFTWTGFYVGANAGYAFGDSTVTTTGLTPDAVNALATGQALSGAKLDKGGFTGGGQIGYNYQVGSVVFGLESDIQYADRNQTVTGTTPAGFTSSYHSKLDYLGTVRGRIGYAMDRWMIYATGGLAYGDASNSYMLTNNTTQRTVASGRSGTETGYAVGGGVEYAIPAFNWGASAATVKVEYLYYNLGSRNITQTDLDGVTPILQNRFKNDGQLVRAGLNWKFSAF